MPTKVQMLRMPMPVWVTTVSSLNTFLLKAIGYFGCTRKA